MTMIKHTVTHAGFEPDAMGQYSSIPHQTFSLRIEPDFHVWTLSELHRKTSVKAIVYHCYVGMSDVLLLVF